ARPARRDRPRLCGRPRPRCQPRRVRAIAAPWARSCWARVSPDLPALPGPLALLLAPRLFEWRREQRSRARRGFQEHGFLVLPRMEPAFATIPHRALEPHLWPLA